MKRTIFKMVIDDESEFAETQVSFKEEDDMFTFCKVLSEIMAKHKEMRHVLAGFVLKSMLEEDSEDKGVSESEMPDFAEVLKNAKVNPNNHIKEN